MLKAIPQKALEIILTDKFAGADLVLLDSEIHRPSFKDCRKVLFGSYCLFDLRVYQSKKILFNPRIQEMYLNINVKTSDNLPLTFTGARLSFIP